MFAFGQIRRRHFETQTLWRRRRAWSAGRVLESLEERLVLSGAAEDSMHGMVAAATMLAVSSQHVAMGQLIALTAEVSQTGSSKVPPSGMVQFFDNGTALGTANVDRRGEANLSVKIMPFGMNTITARYLGDSSHAESLSNQVPITFGNTFERLMNNAYRGLFGTPITASQMQFYNRNFGSTRFTMPLMARLGNSVPARQHLVQDAYAIYMESVPTRQQMAQTLRAARFLGGNIQAGIVGSQAFYQKWSGNTVSGYLDVLASSTVGAPFTPAQRAQFAAEIEHGVPLYTVAYQAFALPMAKEASIAFMYEAVLGRLPTAQEVASASGPARRPVNVLGLEVSLLASSEYRHDLNSNAVPISTTTLTASASDVPAGEPVTFTATIKPSSPISLGPIQGTVQFLDGGNLVGEAPVTSAGFTTATPGGVTATFTTTTLPPGAHEVVAMYMGNVAFAGSASSPVAVTVA
jgi:hypothetical protein